MSSPESSAASLNIALLRRYAELAAKRRDLEEQVDKVKTDLAVLEQQVLEELAATQMRNVNTGEHVIYLQRQVWARPTNGDAERTAAALRAHGAAELVSETVNIQRLSSWVRELERSGEGVPVDLQEYIEVEDRYRAIVRKAPA